MAKHMIKPLYEVCEEAEKTLSFLGSEEGTLLKKAQEWIDESSAVIAYKASVKNQNVIMVVREIEQGSLRHRFSIYRFFPLQGKWVISADLQDKAEGETFQYLVNRFEL